VPAFVCGHRTKVRHTYPHGTTAMSTKTQMNTCAISFAGELASVPARHHGYATTASQRDQFASGQPWERRSADDRI
jgi:hypothetical protein